MDGSPKKDHSEMPLDTEKQSPTIPRESGSLLTPIKCVALSTPQQLPCCQSSIGLRSKLDNEWDNPKSIN